MCGGGGNKRELEIARESARAAGARADAALTEARQAVAFARKNAKPAVDSEAARKAAENEIRARVAEGTYTKTFLGGAGISPATPSIAYRHLTAA